MALSVTAVAASTLTGPAITGLRTFPGNGVSRHTNMTAGIFWRFWRLVKEATYRPRLTLTLTIARRGSTNVMG
jgi:hypothetical protein